MIEGKVREMDCKVYAAAAGLWVRMDGVGAVGVAQAGGGFSYDGEHDLGAMVIDFFENGSVSSDSRCSSDSDSSLCDLANLSDNISDEHDLLTMASSLMLSINECELHLAKTSQCNASCIRFCLVKLLRLSGHDAAVCATRWQGSGKVPGGDHEYIEVIKSSRTGSAERLIIDIDFRSHFEIARPVESYHRMLNYLPVVYVGSLAKLKQLLLVMVEAARFSLKQNSMPLPPWRSLAYLQAKWQSPYHRELIADQQDISNTICPEHTKCAEHLKRLQSLLQPEIELKRLLKPLNGESNQRLKLERQRRVSLRIRGNV